MRWRGENDDGTLSTRDLWATRNGIIFLDEADGVDLLRKALPAPQLDWVQEGGEWGIPVTCAFTLWLDMINMPAVKDVGWLGAGYAFDEKLIDPTLVFARCWPHVMAAMTSEDWAESTPVAFGTLVRTIAATRVAASKKGDFDLQSADLVDLPPFDCVDELRWTAEDAELFQWVGALKYDRGSLADRDGRFSLLKLLEYFVGLRFKRSHMEVDSLYYTALDTLTNFALNKSALNVRERYARLNAVVARDQRSRFANVFAAQLQLLCSFPVLVHEHIASCAFGYSDARLVQLQDFIDYGAAATKNESLAWLIDRYHSSVLKLSPAIASLIGDQSAFWPSTLSQCLLVMRPAAAVVSIQLAKEIEAFLAARPGLIEQVVGDHATDIGARLTDVAHKMGVGTLPSSSTAFSGGGDGGVHSTKPSADASASFAKMAQSWRYSSSFDGIKRDVLLAKGDSKYSQADILRVLLTGATADDLDRVTCSAILTMLFDDLKSPKFDAIDRELHWLPQLRDSSLAQLFGNITNLSLRYPAKCVNLTKLSELVSKIGEIAVSPEKLDLYALAVVPCKRARFPDGKIDSIAQPYGSKTGIFAVLETFCNFFEVLGIQDDAGKAVKPPMSPRSLLLHCSNFLEDYGEHDPMLTSQAVNAVILGSIRGWFLHQFDPARSGRDVKILPSKYLVWQSDANLEGLDTIRDKLSKSIQRQNEDKPDLAVIPYTLQMTLAGAGTGTSGKRKGGADGDEKTGSHDETERAKKLAATQEKSYQDSAWRKTCPLKLEGDNFMMGDRAYALTSICNAMLEWNSITEEEACTMSWPALLLAVMQPERIAEADKFAPGKSISFQGQQWPDRWSEIFNAAKSLKLSQYRADVKPWQSSGKSGGKGSGKAKSSGATDGKGKGKSKSKGNGKGSGKGARGAAAGLLALSTVAGSGAAPVANSPANNAWQRQVTNQIRSQATQHARSNLSAWSGFNVAGSTSALTFLMLSCLLADPCAPNCAVIGDRSGKVTHWLLKGGYRPLAIDPLDSPLPGLRYKGLAEDVIFTRHWLALYIFLPCDDDATAGAQYFPGKVANHTHYWGMFQCICAWHARADAAILEHPATRLEKMWRMADQTVHPYFFGLDDKGISRWKTTKFWIRGWNLVHAVCDVPPGTSPIDVTHALQIYDRDACSQARSELIWPMAKALVEQCNPDTIIASEQPSLADALQQFDTNYAKWYGEHSLPTGHGNLQYLLPPEYAASLPAHRKRIYNDAATFSGRPAPQWPPTEFATDPPLARSRSFQLGDAETAPAVRSGSADSGVDGDESDASASSLHEVAPPGMSITHPQQLQPQGGTAAASAIVGRGAASNRPTRAPTPEVREFVVLDDALSSEARLKKLERRLEEASFKVAKSLLHPLSVDSKGTSHPAFTERPACSHAACRSATPAHRASHGLKVRHTVHTVHTSVHRTHTCFPSIIEVILKRARTLCTAVFTEHTHALRASLRSSSNEPALCARPCSPNTRMLSEHH